MRSERLPGDLHRTILAHVRSSAAPHAATQDFPSSGLVAPHSANTGPRLKSAVSWAFRSAALHRHMKNTLD
jgi:hypothetical protein